MLFECQLIYTRHVRQVYHLKARAMPSLVPSLFSLARGGKESGEVPIQFLFREL